MLRKTMIALMTAAAVGMVVPGVAMARGGGGGGHGGGGFGGGGRGDGFHHAFRARGLGFYDPYAYYDDYNPYYAYDDSYYDDGSCHVVQRRVHTKQGWRYHPVQVCS